MDEISRFNSDRDLFYVDTDFNCPIPRTYWIELSALCNLKCPFCPTGTGVYYNDVKTMSFDVYSKIFDKIKQFALYIYFHRHGEPTLNKRLLQIIRHTADYESIYTTFSTNLNSTTYDLGKAAAVIETGISEIIASIDGTSGDTYSRYRRSGSFERAIGNLTTLAKAKLHLGSITPKLKWQFLINKFNEREVCAAREMAADIGVDIYFLLMDVWGQEDWISSFHKDPQKLIALNASDPSQSAGKEIAFSSPLQCPGEVRLPDYALAHVDNVTIHKHFPWWCAQAFHTMAINTDGSVAPCTEIADSKFNVGSILDTDIRDLWNGEHFKRSRRYIMNREVNGSICERCVRGESAAMIPAPI